MYLKSCTWRWDYKSRVATSLKLFIPHVIALLPPGYLNSLLYLSLWMKSSHLKIITASSVLCPKMTSHTFLHLIAQHGKKSPDPPPVKPWYRETIYKNLLGFTSFCIVFHYECWKELLGYAISQCSFLLLLVIKLYSILLCKWWGQGTVEVGAEVPGLYWRRCVCASGNEMLWHLGLR